MRILLLLATALTPVLLFANNIQVSNVSLINQNAMLNTYVAQFDLTWENSWRTSTFESNWDAAWVVIKYREEGSLTWSHASLQQGGSSFPAGIVGDFAGGTGVFIHRSSNGIGDLIANGTEIQFSYGGASDDSALEVCVIAIEMVYIPQGQFFVGDDSPNAQANFQAGITTNPFLISSEAALTLGGSFASNLNNLNTNHFPADDFNTATTQSLPANYPKGYDAFYIMKYEISQQQYADFLNKLPESALANRYDEGLIGSNGYNISNTGPVPNIHASTTPDRACNFLNWPDIAAYADWIGLRPMSELEYEKACRGDRPPTPGEFAWGNTNIANAAYNYINQGQPNASVNNPGVGTGNAIYSLTDLANNKPSRCGLLAFAAVNKTRQETGGSYFGVMEMTGNLWELVVTVGNAEGRQFTGIHGNGIINNSGNSTVGSTWPSVTLAPIADGTGARGGSYSRAASDITVSGRTLANFDIDSRYSDVTARLVRTAN